MPAGLPVGLPVGLLASLLFTALMLVWGAPAGAQTQGTGQTGAGSAQACAALGPGFQLVPGTNSCVRTGAAVRVEGFTGGSLSPNPGSTPMDTTSALPPPPAAAGTKPSAAAPATAPVDPWKSAR